MSGGTSLNNVASAGDYTDTANAYKGVNAGDLNNAVVDATNAATNKGFALEAADGVKVEKKLGEAVKVVGANSNINTKVVNGEVAIELNKTLNNLDGITVNDGTNSNTGSTVIGKGGITVKDSAGNNIAGVDNTALTVKDAGGVNAETSINKAINSLNAAQTQADNYAVKYDDNSGVVNKNSVTFAGTTGTAAVKSSTGKMVMSGGTSLNNVASAGDYTDTANAYKGVNAGDLNNAVIDVSTSLTNKGIHFGDGNTNNQYKLGETINVKGSTDGSIISTTTADGVQLSLGSSIKVGSLNPVIINGNIGTITGLTNTTWNASNITSGRAATEDQLQTVSSVQKAIQEAIVSSLGGNASANTDGSITGLTYNIAKGTQYTVGDALKALETVVTNANDAVNAGWTLSANSDTATSKQITPNGKINFVGDSNLAIAQTSTADNEGNIQLSLNKDLNVDSITAGSTVLSTSGITLGSTVSISNSGLIIAGGPSVTTTGVNAGNKVITNVADGQAATDAVNKGQLDSAVGTLTNNVTALTDSAVQYDKNSDGSVNKDSITLAGGTNGTKITNVADGNVATGSKDAVNGGQLAAVQEDLQSKITANSTDITNIKNEINSGTVGLVKQASSDAEITVAKDSGGTKVNVSGQSGDRVVTGVASGSVSASSTDAVNGAQLNTSNQYIVSSLGGGAGYDNITQSFTAPSYKVGETSYNNVGDAVTALNDADTALGNRINNLGDQLQQAFYSTNERINSVEKRANAGIAAAMAMEAAPYISGKYTYAAGASYHGGENAIGVTLRKTADNGRWSVTGGFAAASQGDPSVRIGISGVID